MNKMIWASVAVIAAAAGAMVACTHEDASGTETQANGVDVSQAMVSCLAAATHKFDVDGNDTGLACPDGWTATKTGQVHITAGGDVCKGVGSAACASDPGSGGTTDAPGADVGNGTAVYKMQPGYAAPAYGPCDKINGLGTNQLDGAEVDHSNNKTGRFFVQYNYNTQQYEATSYRSLWVTQTRWTAITGLTTPPTSDKYTNTSGTGPSQQWLLKADWVLGASTGAVCANDVYLP